MRKIDDAEYARGRAAFEQGISLQAVVQRMLNLPETADNEAKTFSYAIGFLDGFLDKVRQ